MDRPPVLGRPSGFSVGALVLAVGVVVLITVLVPTGLVGGAVWVRDLGCAWSDTKGVRIARTHEPVTVGTR